MKLQTLQAEQFFFDRMIPVSLFYCQSSELARWHNHEFSEICIIFNGHCTYETMCSTETVEKGDVMVMPAGGSHRFYEESGIEQFNILFQFDKLIVPYRDICRNPGFSALFRLTPQYCLQNNFFPRFRLAESDLKRVVTMLSDAYECQQQKRNGCSLSVYGAFLQVIPILLDNYASSCKIPPTQSTPARLSECLDYMQRNICKNLSVKELSKRACMTQASFIRHFRAATGVTPLNYFLQLKINEACHLLMDDSLSISEIALQMGFVDSNYFTRLFRKKIGLSPRQFREK